MLEFLGSRKSKLYLKNDLEPCGAIFPKYEPLAAYGDPFQATLLWFLKYEVVMIVLLWFRNANGLLLIYVIPLNTNNWFVERCKFVIFNLHERLIHNACVL